MKPEDLEALVVVYKDLFDPRWRGIEFGCGWGDLFAELLIRCRTEKIPPITTTKEKMGTMRFYFADQFHPASRAIRQEAMDRSAGLCEICGAPGETEILRPGYLATRCALHKSQEK